MIVVAGVSGHVGSVVADDLIKAGHKIKVLVRDANKGAEWSKKGAEVAVGSIDDEAALTTALKGAAAFFTLMPPNYASTALYEWQRATAIKQANAVKANKVANVVILSSVGADLDSGNGPIQGLHALENAMRATGAIVTALRAAAFQDNVGMAFAPAKNAGIFPNFGLSSAYAFSQIATPDIGHLAAEQLAGKPTKNEIIDILGPAYSPDQIAAALGKALGKTLNVVNIPENGWVAAMTQGGLPQHAAEVFAEMYAGFATGKIVPKGDRAVHGTTTIDQTIARLLAA